MKKTLVFGASLKPHRYSYAAVRSLKAQGIDTVGFGPVKGRLFGAVISDNIPENEEFHTITLYMGAERQKAYYDKILSLKPQRIIFNPGAENPAFYYLLKEHSIEYEVACTLTLLATGQY
ncbi:MAG: CoA-binding protein [Flavobacteriaceae bacterium]